MNIPALMFNEGGWCEALKTSYAPGRFQPASVDEFKALAPFARKPVPELVEDAPDVPADDAKALPKPEKNGVKPSRPRRK